MEKFAGIVRKHLHFDELTLALLREFIERLWCMKMKYQNYIFDLYGTLVDIHTDEADALAWHKLALFYSYYQARYTPKELKARYDQFVQETKCKTGCENNIADSYEGNPEIQLETVFERFFLQKGVQPEQSLVRHTGQFFRVLTTDYICLYEGVPKMLESLQKMGRRIYLLSNAQKIFTEYELQMLNIACYFDDVLISSDYGVKKPDVRFFISCWRAVSWNLGKAL